MTDLITWLRSALDEHERAAKKAARMRYDLPSDAPWERARRLVEQKIPGSYWPLQALYSPAHVLRTVAAHREILDRHAFTWHFDQILMCRKCGNVMAPCADVRSLAAIYRDHPGFDPDWLREHS